MYISGVAGRNRMARESSYSRVPPIGSQMTWSTLAGPSGTSDNMPTDPIIEPLTQANLQAHTNSQIKENSHTTSSSPATYGTGSNRNTPITSAPGGEETSAHGRTYRLVNFRSYWCPTQIEITTAFGPGYSAVNDPEWTFRGKNKAFNERVERLEQEGSISLEEMSEESRRQFLCLYNSEKSTDTLAEATHHEGYMERVLASRSLPMSPAGEKSV
ncbi:hypothetical protein VTL71DRAFT_6241 [Oculimacula yallundae]|uniref:Uncharacterized protein n=1 Tax=Oculimacula yallundae TaxID=86028 RepID=A0ABR4C1F7_9HELO